MIPLNGSRWALERRRVKEKVLRKPHLRVDTKEGSTETVIVSKIVASEVGILHQEQQGVQPGRRQKKPISTSRSDPNRFERGTGKSFGNIRT